MFFSSVLNHKSNNSTGKNKGYLGVVLFVSILCSFSALSTVTATELNPGKNIKPAQTEPALKNLAETSNLSAEEKKIEKQAKKQTKSKPSWWTWLTNSSKKPASFHYIDIIELLQ